MVYSIIAEDFFLKKSKASSHIFSDVNVELGMWWCLLIFYGFSGTFKGFFGALSGSLEPGNSYSLPPRNCYSYVRHKNLV